MKAGQKMQPYNGYRSWNAWNVSAAIDNDETLYNCLKRTIEKVRNTSQRAREDLEKGKLGFAITIFYSVSGLDEDSRTSDGARFNRRSVKTAISNYLNIRA